MGHNSGAAFRVETPAEGRPLLKVPARFEAC